MVHQGGLALLTFVSRHLGLPICNIAIMINILAFVLATSLSKPDVLTLKSGESYEGEFIRKKGTEIIFKVESDELGFKKKKFPISDIETIQTKKGGLLTYPFDKPQKIFNAQAVICCAGPIIVLLAIATPGSDS